MSEEIVVILVVGVIFSIFFFMAHKADKVVKEKATQRLEQVKNQTKVNNKKEGKKSN